MRAGTNWASCGGAPRLLFSSTAWGRPALPRGLRASVAARPYAIACHEVYRSRSLHVQETVQGVRHSEWTSTGNSPHGMRKVVGLRIRAARH